MITFIKLLILVLLTSGISSQQVDEIVKSIAVNPQKLVEVTLLGMEEDEFGVSQYTYKCTVGSYKTGHVGCNRRDRLSWASPHNVALTLRCPQNGGGRNISYVEIIYTVTTHNKACHVINGGVNSNFIKMEVDVFGTKLLDYTSNIYVH